MIAIWRLDWSAGKIGEAVIDRSNQPETFALARRGAGPALSACDFCGRDLASRKIVSRSLGYVIIRVNQNVASYNTIEPGLEFKKAPILKSDT